MKSARYLLGQYISIIGKMEGTGQDPAAKEAFNKEFGGFLRITMGFGTYSYIRANREIRKAGMIEGMVSKVIEQAIRQLDEGVDLTDKQLENIEMLLETVTGDE